MDDDKQHSRLRKVGAVWKPKPGAKSKGSGSVTINGLRQRFVILVNERKKEGSREPDYLLMSSDPPEVNDYAPKTPAQTTLPPAEDPFA